MQNWQSLRIAGLPTAWLDCIHGYGAKPIEPVALATPVLISALRFRGEENKGSSFLLETEFVSTQLHANAAAQLKFLKPLPVGDPKGLMPLTAALTQQWLISDSLSMHAAVFQLHGRTLMVLGNSHAGKSTLVRSAMLLGARVVSDDFVRLKFQTASDNDLERRAVQVSAISLRGFVRFRALGTLPDELIWIRPEDPRFADTLPIDAVVFLDSKARGARTEIQAITQLEATAQLINQCAPLFLRHEFQFERAKMLQLIRILLKGIPVLRATTGFDVINTPKLQFARLYKALWPEA